MKFPFSDQSWKLLVRSSRERAVLVSYIEEKICSQVLPEPELEASLLSEYKPSSWNESKPDILYAATRLEKLKRFKRAAFLLQVEEFYSKTRSLRENIIFSMLRCSSLSRLKELSLAIQEGELDFASAAIRWSEGPESSNGGRIGPIPAVNAGHQNSQAS